MSKIIVAATRLNVNSIGQARDGLIALGYPKAALGSVSSILRIAFLFGLSNLRHVINLENDPSDESMDVVVKRKKIMKIGKKIVDNGR